MQWSEKPSKQTALICKNSYKNIILEMLLVLTWYLQHFNLTDPSGIYLLTIRSMLLTKKLQAREWPRRLEATETMAPIDSCAKVSSESDRLKTWMQIGNKLTLSERSWPIEYLLQNSTCAKMSRFSLYPNAMRILFRSSAESVDL